MKYEFLEHTADTKFRAYGESLNEVFANAGLAFMEVITDPASVKRDVKKEFTVQAEDLKSLLYDFLEELLILHESENLLFNQFEVKINKEDFSLTTIAWGETIKDHELRNPVKAITYSEMKVSEEMAQVVLDL